MIKSKLAIEGGNPVIDYELKLYNGIGQEEKKSVSKIMDTGLLSGFYANWGEEFYGGPNVLDLERNWSTKFKTKYSVSVNSAASGLTAAVGAAKISPGDEVLVPATSMSATVMAVLIYGGIPVFVDLDLSNCCMDLNETIEKINSKTKAVIVTNLFGHIAHLSELRSICEKKNLILIEDNAQAPLGEENGKYAGTIGHIGVFSLNYHKHIHSGEGGICCTNSDDLALRMQMIRNHAEACVEEAGMKDITNMIGFNFRMTELSAAIANIQLKNIEDHVARRLFIANKFNNAFAEIEGITPPIQRSNSKAVYYLYQLIYDEEITKVSRTLFVKALEGEGFPCLSGYLRPLYNLPIFKKKIALGNKGFPFNLSQIDYNKVYCKNAEELYKNKLLGFDICNFDLNNNEVNLLIKAFLKVVSNLDVLRSIEK